MKKILIAFATLLASFSIVACDIHVQILDSGVVESVGSMASSIEENSSEESVEESSGKTSEESFEVEISSEDSSAEASESILEGDAEKPETSASDWIDIEFPRPQ